MLGDLEQLIEALLAEISCYGDLGCPVSQVLATITAVTTITTLCPDQPEDGKSPSHHVPEDGQDIVRQGLLSTVWDWLREREDISVGSNREWNHLTLSEILALPEPAALDVVDDSQLPDVKSDADGLPSQRTGDANTNTNANTIANDTPPQQADQRQDVPLRPRVYVSESRMWDFLAGHAADFKRIPKLEWAALVGIASTKSEGILQRDLCDLVGQDKRSLPRRTDTLADKGYIVKRPTIARGVRTSKLWLRKFAPQLPGNLNAEANEPLGTVSLDLDPVSWCNRWTGDSIDMSALARTVVHVIKAWNIIKYKDLRLKLGIEGSRWQMQCTARLCRWMAGRGLIQFVGATLGDRLFKDCLKFVRDFTSDDWTQYLAFGKAKDQRRPKADALEPNEDEVFRATKQKVAHSPRPGTDSSTRPWKPEKPLPNSIIDAIRLAGPEGTTNKQIGRLTIGMPFRRHVTSLTTVLATPSLQPKHLTHFQVTSGLRRVNKAAVYFFSLPYFQKEGDADATTTAAAAAAADARNMRTETLSEQPSSASHPDIGVLFNECFGQHEQSRFAPEPGTLTALSLLASKRPRRRIIRAPPPADLAGQQASAKGNDEKTLEESSALGGAAARITLSEEPSPLVLYKKRTGRGRKPANFVVTIKVPVEFLGKLSDSDPRATIPTSASDANAEREDGQGKTTVVTEEAAADADQSDEDQIHKDGKGNKTRNKKGAKPTSFRCEKCGRVWKNDNGLKYHMEKSSSACNPSYVPSFIKAPRRRRFLVDEPEPAPPAQDGAASPLGPRRSGRNAGKDGGDMSKDMGHYERRVNISHPAALRARTARRSDAIIVEIPTLTAMEGESTQTPPAGESGPSSEIKERNGDGKWTGLWYYDDTVSDGLLPAVNIMVHGVSKLDAEAEVGRISPLEASQESPGRYRDVSEVESLHQSSGGAQQQIGMGKLLPARSLVSSTSPAKKRATSSHGADLDTFGYGRGSKFHRAADIILRLIHENGGAFPGGWSLWIGIVAVWEKSFPSENPPNHANSGVVVTRLESRKMLSRATYAFRDAKGSFASCEVLLAVDVDSQSPAALSLKESMIAEHPRCYVPAAFLPEGGIPGEATWNGQPVLSGRRRLGNDIEVLDAPFYANSIANNTVVKRRGPGSNFEHGTPRKRQKRQSATDHEQAMPTFTSAFYTAGPQVRLLEPIYGPEMDQDELSSAADEDSDVVEDEEPTSLAADASEQPALAAGVFVGAKVILGSPSGYWPKLRTSFFQHCSFTINGWMPGPRWFLRAYLPHSLSDIAPRQRPPQDGTPYDDHASFVAQVTGCSKWEHSAEGRSLTRLGSVAPDYIYIHHEMHCDVPWRHKPLLWPGDSGWSINVDAPPHGEHEEFDQGEDGQPLSTRTRRPAKKQKLTEAQERPILRYQAMELKTRIMMPFERPTAGSQGRTLKGSDDSTLLAGFVATRTLLGGADKFIEWGLLMKLFPDKSLSTLRKFWAKARKDRPASVQQLTERFQTQFIAAYERGDLPPVDFDDYKNYDWVGLIRWTVSLVDAAVALPSNRADLDRDYTLDAALIDASNWQDEYYNFQSSIFNRLEALSSVPAQVLIDKGAASQPSPDDDFVRAKSWVRALCHTSPGRYSPERTKAKMLTLTGLGEEHNEYLVERAISSLQVSGIIARTVKKKPDEYIHRLSEWFFPRLAKSSNASKFNEAARFKQQLDDVFRKGETIRIPYVLKDGEVMAMINLQAHRRLEVCPVDIPDIPLGFKPGEYESRKFPKSFYNFGLEVKPTEGYIYDEDIADALQLAERSPPLAEDANRALPLWSDFFGLVEPKNWLLFVQAITFVIAMRGPLDARGVVVNLKPYVEEFEAQMVIDWGLRNGLYEESFLRGGYYNTTEWWWLIVGRMRGVEAETSQGVSEGG